jgi:hypothetical protein
MRYPVVFLPGIIAPATIRYGPLFERLDDVDVLVRDLAVYDGDAPPADYSMEMELRALDRAAEVQGSHGSTSAGTRAEERSHSPMWPHAGIASRVWR